MSKQKLVSPFVGALEETKEAGFPADPQVCTWERQASRALDHLLPKERRKIMMADNFRASSSFMGGPCGCQETLTGITSGPAGFQKVHLLGAENLWLVLDSGI